LPRVVTTPAGGLDVAYSCDLSALRGGAANVVLFSVSGTAPGFVGDPARPLLPLNPR